MGKVVDWEGIPDSAVVDDGIYLLAVESLEETVSQSGKLMYHLTARIEEPSDFSGLFQNEYFCVGTDDDPGADDPETWRKSISARILKRFIKAAQIPMDGDMDMICASAEGSKFLARIIQIVDDGKKNPEYKGNISNSLKGFFTVGEREVGLDGGGDSTPPPPVATRPAARTAPAKRAPAKPAATAAAKPKPAAAKAAKRPTTIACGICQEQVERADFAAHVGQHEDEE
ncbi:hypothetical protein IIA15_00230 [candidate division TA06 bacterium]|nr:hypothetical protein [candidate division TA06 bacterium]